MKRLALVVAVMVVVSFPVLANATLINLGYNVHAYRDSDFSRLGIGPVFTFFVGETNGFYAQLAPFWATGPRSGSTTYRYRNLDPVGGGLNFLLGFGRDISFGPMGLLVGGGLFGAGYALYNTWSENLLYIAGAGPGGGLHFYFRPGPGRLLLNLGVNAAWRPFKVWGTTDWGFEGFHFEKGEFNYNINAGIGFRR